MRVIEAGHRFDQTLDYIALIEDGKLHSDTRPARGFRRRPGNVSRVFVVVIDQPIAMQAVRGQNKKHQEIGNHHRQVKGVDVIDAPKSRVGDFVPILADACGMRGEQRRSEKECVHVEGSLQSELVSGCGAIDYTAEAGTVNDTRPALRRRPLRSGSVQ